MNGEHQILIAIYRFSKWPIVKTCKSSETKEVVIFSEQNFNLYGLPEKITDKEGAFFSKECRQNCKSKNFEIENSTPRLHTGTGAVEHDTNIKELNHHQSGRQFMPDRVR